MADITVTIPNSTFTITAVSSDIEVTTPTEVVVEVNSGTNTIEITSTPDEITVTEVGITNTDQLIEGTTNLFFTNARARSAISLTTDDTAVLDYNSSTGVFTWDTPTTTKILEGTNLYFTNGRADARAAIVIGASSINALDDVDTATNPPTSNQVLGWDGTKWIPSNAASIGAVTSVNGDGGPVVVLDTDDINEGTTNKYFSQSLARQSLSAGTGISYDSGTGIITNTSINTDTTYTQNASATTGGANLNLVGSDSTTDSVKFASGTNITVTRTDANTITIDGSDLNTTYTIASSSTSGGANLTLTGSDSSTDSVAYLGSGATTVNSTDANTITISSTDTNTTYTQNISSTSGGANLNLVGSDSTTDTVKFANGTGVAVAYTDANTATISIGQSVATTDAVTFGSVNIDSRAVIDTATLTTSATTADQVLDSFTASTYRTAKYIVSISSGTDYQSLEILVVHNGTTASQTTYADIKTGSSDLATFNVDIDAGSVRLLTTPINAVTAYNVTRTAIVV